jgi:hypothetical protein
MNADLVTVVTGTLGDSASHLSRVLTELRAFTHIPFRQVVSDDGSARTEYVLRQRAVCEAHGAEWTENPGPVFGISYNLNHLMRQIRTPWAFIVEDSVRPGWGWLETALDALHKVGLRDWQNRKVAAVGMASSFEAWHMAAARVLPWGGLPEFFDTLTAQSYASFWGSSEYPEHWNDGYWCWKRMEPGTYASCADHAADSWPEIVRRTWRDPVLRREIGAMHWTQIPQGSYAWQHRSGWPATRGAAWSYGPSAWCLVRKEAWEDVGGFRDGCTFYEGHFGVKLARAGWLSINCECPPWLHYSGLATRIAHEQRGPRHNQSPDGPGGALEQDFGVNGPDHVDVADLARSYFRKGELDRINWELAGIDLYMDPGWEKWL